MACLHSFSSLMGVQITSNWGSVGSLKFEIVCFWDWKPGSQSLASTSNQIMKSSKRKRNEIISINLFKLVVVRLYKMK